VIKIELNSLNPDSRQTGKAASLTLPEVTWSIQS